MARPVSYTHLDVYKRQEQVVVEPLDVLGQGVIHQSGPAFLLACLHMLVPVFLGKIFGVGDDVRALVRCV